MQNWGCYVFQKSAGLSGMFSLNQRLHLKVLWMTTFLVGQKVEPLESDGTTLPRDLDPCV